MVVVLLVISLVCCLVGVDVFLFGWLLLRFVCFFVFFVLRAFLVSVLLEVFVVWWVASFVAGEAACCCFWFRCCFLVFGGVLIGECVGCLVSWLYGCLLVGVVVCLPDLTVNSQRLTLKPKP